MSIPNFGLHYVKKSYEVLNGWIEKTSEIPEEHKDKSFIDKINKALDGVLVHFGLDEKNGDKEHRKEVIRSMISELSYLNHIGFAAKYESADTSIDPLTYSRENHQFEIDKEDVWNVSVPEADIDVQMINAIYCMERMMYGVELDESWFPQQVEVDHGVKEAIAKYYDMSLMQELQSSVISYRARDLVESDSQNLAFMEASYMPKLLSTIGYTLHYDMDPSPTRGIMDRLKREYSVGSNEYRSRVDYEVLISQLVSDTKNYNNGGSTITVPMTPFADGYENITELSLSNAYENGFNAVADHRRELHQRNRPVYPKKEQVFFAAQTIHYQLEKALNVLATAEKSAFILPNGKVADDDSVKKFIESVNKVQSGLDRVLFQVLPESRLSWDYDIHKIHNIMSKASAERTVDEPSLSA